MDGVILQKCYRVGPQGNPKLSCENGCATCSWPHLYPQCCGIFCEVKLTEIWNTRSPRLHWPHSTTRSSVESVLVFTLHISLLVSQNAGNTHRVISRPACCLSYASDKHWSLRNVHFVNTDLWDMQSSIESCPSPCMIIQYGAWPPTKINQKPIMSLHQDLVDFIPFVSFLGVVDHIMAG